jgi:hypothetical protein
MEVTAASALSKSPNASSAVAYHASTLLKVSSVCFIIVWNPSN